MHCHKMSNVVVKVAVVALLACIAASGVSHAQSAKQLRNQLERSATKIQQNRERVKQLERDKVEIQQVIQGYDRKIETQQSELRNVKQQLEQAETELNAAETEREKLVANLKKYRVALGNRMRAVYMAGDLSYLDLLFNASDFGDFVDRLFFVQSICSRDGELIQKTQQDEAALIVQGQLIAQKIEEINVIRAQQEQHMAVLQKAEREKQNDLASVAQSIELYNRETIELEAQNRRITADIRSLTSSGSSSRYRGKAWTMSFLKPTNGSITSGFGFRRHPIFGGNRKHTGIDFGAPRGTAILAAGDGKVIHTGRRGGYGLTVILDHGNGRSTLYAHCSSILIEAGKVVKAGEKIAAVGSTGTSTGNHLHFEVLINGVPVDPMGVTSL